VSDERKVALVTGGSKRVGRAIVERLARDGWDVAFTFRHSQKQALQLQNDLASAGVRVLPLNADFDRLDQTIAMLRERFIKWSPRLDLLVNNASAYAPDTKLSADAAMRANYVAPVRLIETFRGELASANGSVVNMLDILAERPMPSFSNYSASKAALWNATLSLARSLAPAVRVNGIAPGVVEWSEQTPEADREAYVKKVPLQRIGTAGEAATLVKFLAVDATFITGQVFRIDGGRSLL
jgi:pteridine reductase